MYCSYFAYTIAVVGLGTLIFFRSKKNAFSHWKTFIITKLILYFNEEKFQNKLKYKNLKTSTSPIDVGLVPKPLEYDIEKPHKGILESCDGIHFFGIDSNQNMIDLCINKIQESIASVWLVLKLSPGQIYKLSLSQDTRTAYIDSETVFQSSGLQIKCLSPFRKWRISFNGLLQKYASEHNDETETELVHAKFSFVWLAMSVVRELNSDLNFADLIQTFSTKSYNAIQEQFLRFRKFQNNYEQWGQLMGTIKLKEETERDLYLWSCRTRIANDPLLNEDILNSKFYMYFEDGFPLKIESLTMTNSISNFTNGYTVTGLGTSEEISCCDFDINKFKNEKNTNAIQVSFLLTKSKKIINIHFTGEEISFYSGLGLEQNITLKPFEVTLDNGDSGFGILHLISRSNHDLPQSFETPLLLLKDSGATSSEKSIVLLNDDLCKSSQIVGGKGCSLGLLTHLATKASEFSVPKGFVITTLAFERHIENNPEVKLAIEKLKRAACQRTVVDLQQKCTECMNVFNASKLSESLKQEIEKVLSSMYESLENMRFSIRSSAYGEDGEDLSAAGQMLTILGVRSLKSIIDAIINCWSSKFSFESVQYSRQNGQLITSPMAVVVQEMVPSEVSGVLFTTDPVTGDPTYPCITANYGLGETVVSALAEPDTIMLKRNVNNSLSVFKKIVGSKKSQVHMKDGNGTEQKFSDNETTSCLTDKLAVKIGNVGMLIEKYFCGPRDIEWALHKGELFLLQARPITTLHTETDFELIHDQDTPIRSDHEYWTRANTGEVFLGATSPLAVSVVVNSMDLYAHRNQILREFRTQFCPYVSHVLPVTHKQVTISLIDTLFRNNEKEITNNQKAFEVALFGRLVTTKRIHEVGVKRYGYSSRARKIFGFAFLGTLMFSIPKSIDRLHKKIESCVPHFENFIDIASTWQGILDQYSFYSEVSSVHGMATFLSSFYNMIVMNILAKGTNEWDSVLYGDFATLLSSCNKVESANVPESLQELAKTIAMDHGETFSSLPPNIAYDVLRNDNGKAGKLFENFILKHGHRCVKEFDIYSVSWGMEPETLMPIIQNIVSSPNILKQQEKKDVSVEAAISKLKTPLSKFSKIFLKIVLPWSRQAVGQRERTKSMLIKTVNWFRQSFYHLGDLFVQEGLLPEGQLIFFLTLEEIKDMMEHRTPGLVPKAIRRRRLHPTLNNLQFPEIIEGVPKPIPEENNVSKYASSFSLKGTPVCQGKVKATATVVLSLEEARNIKSGDILITHSTDIGWSPYFPLLSGVVTVLGGLISHGAVVAREYGLPCVVGVQNATSAFKSGDIVILDGTSGTVTKVASHEEENI